MDATHDLPDAQATAQLGAAIAAILEPGDTVMLEGVLGAGKSVLCRGLLRTLTGNAALEVPSPTYTLVQAYSTRAGRVHHYDLWRLGGPEALEEIGFFDVAGDIRLVEWSERLAEWGVSPSGGRCWTVTLAFSRNGRHARIRAPDRVT